MKTLLALLLIVAVGWGAWYLVHKNNTYSTTALISASPTQFGQGGEGTPDTNSSNAAYNVNAQGSAQTLATATPVAHATTQTTVRRTVAPTSRTAVRTTTTVRPTASPSPSNSNPTVTSSPDAFLAFRDINGINGFSENGVLAIMATSDGRTQLNFNVPNGPTSSQTMYIYNGTSCTGSTQIAYGLNPLVNGSSMTILPISPQALVNGNYVVVINMPGSSVSRVACAMF